MTDRGKPLAFILFAVLLAFAAGAQTAFGQGEGEATVWYLRHAGWAVRQGQTLLVFDYQESRKMEDVTADTPRNLENGFIDPAEISELDVFIFVTHAHSDHYDPVIFEWQGEIENLTYVIGWEEAPESHCERFVGDEANCYTMEGLRASAQAGGLQIYTIDSHHNDIPEVAYLVRVGDWVVYHNGDYMADYQSDYAYLKAFADGIDIAFVAGVPSHRWQHLARAVHLANEFAVPTMFAMHYRDDEMCESFQADMVAEGVSADVICPTSRGQRFVVRKGGDVR